MHLAALSLLVPSVLIAPAEGAGTAIWLRGRVDPTALPEARHLDPDQLAPDLSFSARDEQASAHLAAELKAVRPLLDVFDGELQILRRLDLALDAVELLREEDRALVFQARTLQGLAAWRFFGEDLSAEESSAWRVTLVEANGATLVANRAWADAIALDPDSLPNAEILPDEAARQAFQDLRARMLVLPDASIVVSDLPGDARLVIDGREQATERARVLPGEHRVAIQSSTGTRVRTRLRVAGGQTVPLEDTVTATDLRAAAYSLDPKAGTALIGPVATRLAALEQPVTIFVSDDSGTTRYTLMDGVAVPAARAPSSPASTARFTLRAGASASWLSDGEWYLQHAAEGAAHEASTVNGVLPGLHLAGQAMLGPVALGLGLDARAGFGANQRLLVGEDSHRLRLYPHLSAGLPWVQATVGAALPWRLGLGARAHIPIAGPLEWSSGFLYELGMIVPRPEGDSFKPEDAISAWTGLGLRWSP